MTDSAASEQVPRITPTLNGPYEVTGEVQIVAPDGTVIRETSKAYLCRCGHSGNKPFCDGSHRRVGWTEEVSAAI